MPGTKSGGQALRETMIAKHGSEEAWKNWLREQASVGGKNGHTGGFYNHELASEAGKIGKRGKSMKTFRRAVSDGV